MEVRVQFANKENFTSQQRAQIQSVVERSASHAGELLGLEGPVTFFVYSHPGETTVGGKCLTRDRIQLDVPRELDDVEIESTVYHEVCHIPRMYFIEAVEPCSLIESVFAEGLAVEFEVMQVPRGTPLYLIYDVEELRKWFPALKTEMWSTTYNHSHWFFLYLIEEEVEVRMLGYRLGKYFIDQILARYSEETPITLVRRSVEELLQMSGVEL